MQNVFGYLAPKLTVRQPL